MVDVRFFVITSLIVNYTQVDVGEELAGHISNLLMPCVVVHCIVVELRLRFSKLHIVHANAIIGQSFSMHISDRLANLKELLILLHCKFKLSQVVIKHSC